jgi:hypothetical protein
VRGIKSTRRDFGGGLEYKKGQQLIIPSFLPYIIYILNIKLINVMTRGLRTEGFVWEHGSEGIRRQSHRSSTKNTNNIRKGVLSVNGPFYTPNPTETPLLTDSLSCS